MAKRWPLLLGIVAGFAALALALSQPVDTVEQWQMAARWTARVGFPIFLAAYVARPLAQLWPSNIAKGMLARRRWIGLGFASSHTVHLYALVMALKLSGETRGPEVLIVGGGAYAMLYAMALTSNDAAARAMGKWWKVLHRTGIHWLWFVFTISYFGRIFDPERELTGLVLFPFALAAAFVRFAAWMETRRKLRARTGLSG